VAVANLAVPLIWALNNARFHSACPGEITQEIYSETKGDCYILSVEKRFW
jgi:hypothetical protein